MKAFLFLHGIPALALIALAASGGTAHAYVKTSGTMCGRYDPGDFCPGGKAPVKAKTPLGNDWSGSDTGNPWDDHTVDTYRPSSPSAARNQLVIFLHGTGSSADSYDTDPTTGQVGFLNEAANLGYHVIAPDWPDEDHLIATYCGCYRDCYGDWAWIRWMGGSKNGLRTIASAESISGRVRAVLKNRIAGDPSGGWSQFLDSTRDGGIAWSRVVLSGHSQGGDLATYLAKHEKVARLITFSSADEELSSTIGSNGGAPTMYRYGIETGLGVCTPTAAPDESETDRSANAAVVAGYIADNGYNGFGGFSWATPLGSLYAFNDAFDTVGPWSTIYAVLETLDLETVHAPSDLDGFLNVSSSSTAAADLSAAGYHWLTSFFNFSSPSQCGDTCSGAPGPCNGHSQVVATAACQQGSIGESKRIAVWKYMLTH